MKPSIKLWKTSTLVNSSFYVFLHSLQIRNFLLNDSEDEELKEIIRTFPGESSNRAQELNERFLIGSQGLQEEQQEQEEQFQQEEAYHRKNQQEQGKLLREEKQEEERLHREHLEEEERLRREYQEEKLRKEQCEEDEKLRREQQREEEERLHRQHQEETLRREQQEEDRQRKERQQEVRLRREQQEEKFHKENLGGKLWWEQETEKQQWDQSSYHRDQHNDNAFYNDTMQPHVESELLSVRYIKEDNDARKDSSQTLPVLPPVWGCPPLVPPPSPSRPKSPWGKLDPYDSSEVIPFINIYDFF